MSEDRLNAFAMISIEKNLIRDSIDFNQNEIDMFLLKLLKSLCAFL